MSYENTVLERLLRDADPRELLALVEGPRIVRYLPGMTALHVSTRRVFAIVCPELVQAFDQGEFQAIRSLLNPVEEPEPEPEPLLTQGGKLIRPPMPEEQNPLVAWRQKKHNPVYK